MAKEVEDSQAFLEALGGAIREARVQRGLSQRLLGLEADTLQDSISKIENGPRNLTLAFLIRLCRPLGGLSISVGKRADADVVLRCRE